MILLVSLSLYLSHNNTHLLFAKLYIEHVQVYEVVVVDNPWWAIYSQQCPQCKQQQVRTRALICLPTYLPACLPACLPVIL